jgi:uncharacterized protein DUF6894
MLYHFHIREQGFLIRDEEGSDLPDMAAAQAEARASSQDLLIEELKCGVAPGPKHRDHRCRWPTAGKRRGAKRSELKDCSFSHTNPTKI